MATPIPRPLTLKWPGGDAVARQRTPINSNVLLIGILDFDKLRLNHHLLSRFIEFFNDLLDLVHPRRALGNHQCVAANVDLNLAPISGIDQW